MWKNKATALFNSLRKEKEKNSLSVEKRSCREYKIKKKYSSQRAKSSWNQCYPFTQKLGITVLFFLIVLRIEKGGGGKDRKRERGK